MESSENKKKNFRFIQDNSYFYNIIDTSINELSDITIKPTSTSPAIIAHNSDNFFGIMGVSIMYEQKDFYLPIFQWLENYLRTEPQEFKVEFWLDYHNSIASVIFLEMLQGFERYKIKYKNTKVIVNWYFYEEDEDTKKLGEFYQTNLKEAKLNLISYEWDSDFYNNMRTIFQY